MSPAMKLLQHVWTHCQYASHGQMNHSMQQALSLAISSGMTFGKGDFAAFGKNFRFGYWSGAGSDGGEGWYSYACGEGYRRSHGPNPSAIASYEHWKKRTPFLLEQPGMQTRVRLCAGRTFIWRGTEWTCTTFDDASGAVRAVTYKPRKEGEYSNKVDKRLTITHAEVSAYHAELRAAKKRQAKAVAEPAAN